MCLVILACSVSALAMPSYVSPYFLSVQVYPMNEANGRLSLTPVAGLYRG